MTPEHDETQEGNRRMGLILASVAVVFFVGFIVRMVWFSGR
jgi:hypothetical protein